MLTTFHSLVSELLPDWLFAVAQPAPRRVVPAPHTEAAAAAWLMSREQKKQRAN
jgi:hypothetical protein